VLWRPGVRARSLQGLSSRERVRLVGLGALEALYGALVLASMQDPIHHIATNKNHKRPPQWLQQFEDLFAKVRKAVWSPRRLRFPTCVGCIAILL